MTSATMISFILLTVAMPLQIAKLRSCCFSTPYFSGLCICLYSCSGRCRYDMYSCWRRTAIARLYEFHNLSHSAGMSNQGPHCLTWIASSTSKGGLPNTYETQPFTDLKYDRSGSCAIRSFGRESREDEFLAKGNSNISLCLASLMCH